MFHENKAEKLLHCHNFSAFSFLDQPSGAENKQRSTVPHLTISALRSTMEPKYNVAFALTEGSAEKGGTKMAPVKIIFFDIDGTLIDSKTGRISEKTRYTLHQLQKNGIKRCIVTGRPVASLPDFGDLEFDVLATFNGCYCYTDQAVIYSNPIDPADVRIVMQNAAALGRPVSVAARDRLAANGIDRDLYDYYRLSGLELTVAEDFEETCREDIYQIMLGCRESDFPAIIRDAANVKLASSWERAVDVIPLTGGKGSAIRHILEHYGLDPSQAIAFGDNHNDIEMLQAVGMGVAMGNATPQLKAIADEVCGPVSEDGIYHYCVDHGLI